MRYRSVGGVAVCVLLLAAPIATPAMAGAAFDKQSAAPAQQGAKATKLERPKFTASEQLRATVSGFHDIRFWANSVDGFRQALPTVQGPWLALSGGGDDGAFGAGYLAGWTASGKRPDFALVTGASTGALMAPFVFLGARYDDALHKNYTTITAADVFEFGSTPVSLLDDWPLKKTIEKRVTPELLQAVAAEYNRGRRLFVVTTNLDAGRPVVWNMGAIAAQGGERALKLFRAVLLASSSIPGMFQPVRIDVTVDGRQVNEMHADGTITAPFYMAPEAVLKGNAGLALPTHELYVIINSKLRPDFELVEPTQLSIIGRFISIALKKGLRMEIAQMQRAADRLSLKLGLVSIPESFHPAIAKPFDPRYMTALYALGEEQGRALAMNCLSLACGQTRQAWRELRPSE